MLKTSAQIIVATLTTTAALATNALAVPITAGTQFGLDFGITATDTVGNDWNEFSSDTTDNTIHNLNSVTLDGVSVTVAGFNGFNNDGTNNWLGLSTNGGTAPAPFVDSVTTDIGFDLNDLITVSISGLNNSLRYNIYAVSAAGFPPVDTYTVTGDIVYGPSAISRPSAVSNGLFHTFLSVGTNGSGNITISVTDGNGTNPIINGILIQAVPEPSSLAMLAFGMMSLWLFKTKRRLR